MPGQGSGGLVDLVGQIGHAVIGQGHGVGVEGVGLQEVCPGLHVGVVDGANDLRFGQTEEIVVARKVAGMVGEPLASEIGFAEVVALYHGAHGAIHDQNPLLQKVGEEVGGFAHDDPYLKFLFAFVIGSSNFS